MIDTYLTESIIIIIALILTIENRIVHRGTSFHVATVNNVVIEVETTRSFQEITISIISVEFFFTCERKNYIHCVTINNNDWFQQCR